MTHSTPREDPRWTLVLDQPRSNATWSQRWEIQQEPGVVHVLHVDQVNRRARTLLPPEHAHRLVTSHASVPQLIPHVRPLPLPYSMLGTAFQFPDVSEYTPAPLVGAPVAIARSTIGLTRDTHYAQFVADAGWHNVPLLAYHFLNDEALGVTPEAQADFCHSVIGSRALMLDDEPNRGYCASLGQSIRFIDRFRANGGIVHLDYLPKWSWSGWMGSPSLLPLRDRQVHTVSSSYTAYSDTGPGWASYGEVTPVQWQFADNHSFNGVLCDWNAFRGSVSDYLTLSNGQGGFMGTTDNIIAAWSQGNSTGVGGEDVEPVKWRIRDEAWQRSISDALATLVKNVTAASGQEQADAQSVLAALKSGVDVTTLAHTIATELIAAGTNDLTPASLDAVKQVIVQVLGQVRLTTP